uniref:YLP motif-containing protein 1 n=1 Tax=Cynoglossus semilaevis TaxID=244447 RepID=A0A3P8X3Z9_CYNSE
MYPSWGNYPGQYSQNYGGPGARKPPGVNPAGGFGGFEAPSSGSLFSSLQEQHLQQMQQLQMLHQKQLQSVLHHGNSAGAYGAGYTGSPWQPGGSGSVDNSGEAVQPFYKQETPTTTPPGQQQPPPPPPQPLQSEPQPPPPESVSSKPPENKNAPKLPDSDKNDQSATGEDKSLALQVKCYYHLWYDSLRHHSHVIITSMSTEMQLRHYEMQQQHFTPLFQNWEHSFALWYGQFQTYPHKDQLKDYELQWKQWQEQMNATKAHLQERVTALTPMVQFPPGQYNSGTMGKYSQYPGHENRINQQPAVQNPVGALGPRGPPMGRGGHPFMRGRPPMTRGGPPMMRGGHPSMRGSPQMIRGGISMMRGGPPMARGGPPMPRGGPPMARGGPPMPRGGPPMPRGGLLMAKGGAPLGKGGAVYLWLKGGPPLGRGGPPMPRGGPPMVRGGPPMPRGGLLMARGGPPMGRGGPSIGRGGLPMGRGEPHDMHWEDPQSSEYYEQNETYWEEVRPPVRGMRPPFPPGQRRPPPGHPAFMRGRGRPPHPLHGPVDHGLMEHQYSGNIETDPEGHPVHDPHSLPMHPDVAGGRRRIPPPPHEIIETMDEQFYNDETKRECAAAVQTPTAEPASWDLKPPLKDYSSTVQAPPTVIPKTLDYAHGHESGTTVERISYGERIVLRPDPVPSDRDPYSRDPYYERRGDPYMERREYSRERELYREKLPPDYERERFDRERYPPREREDSRDRIDDPYRRPGYDRPPYERSGLDRSAPELDRRSYHEDRGPAIPPPLPPPPQPAPRVEKKPEIKNIDDILKQPGRQSRPERIVIILRGLPGSGKSHVAKLIRDKEVECGGAPPRVLVLDDYFMTEVEKVEKDPDTGRRIKTKVLEYEYEPEMEDTYRNSMLKTFKKTLDDGFFPFIILDSVNDRVKHFDQFWSAAKTKGFEVGYLASLMHFNCVYSKESMSSSWEPSPRHMVRLDVRSLLQDAAIEEVRSPALKHKHTLSSKHRPSLGYIPKSKWEMDTSEAKLDKLDGLGSSGKRKRDGDMADLEDYLQLPDDYATRLSQPGKKRVRWADLEEQKDADRKRAIGFVVGQTDWERITDESGKLAQRALNRTKYF